MNVQFWIAVFLGCILSYHPVHPVGCRTLRQKFFDTIDLALVDEELVDDESDDVNATSGQRLVKKYKQAWRRVDVLGHGATYDAVSNELIIGKFAECIWLDLKSEVPKISLKEASDIVEDELGRRFVPTVNDRNSKLFIYVDPSDNKAKLIWFMNGIVEIPDQPSFSGAVAIVDGNTGNILQLHEALESYLMSGDGGNVKVGRHHYGKDEYVGRKLNVQGCPGCPKCIASNSLIEITSANHQQYYWEPFRCFSANTPYEEKCDPSSPSADATNQSYSQVHDALYYATTFREMLRDVYRDKSLNNCNKKTGIVKICVHYDFRNLATFKDTGNCEIYFGFGYKYFYDPVAPTLVAHELGHALIKVTSNMQYSCQSGAIAESFSDICGVTFNAYINNMHIDWSVGREIKREGGLLSAVRFFRDPPSDGISIDCTKDYPWNKKCREQDPHIYAGVYNKAFYNLVNTPGWDILQAFGIFLRATKFYWKAQDGFNDALCGLIEATIDTFGKQGKDVAYTRATEVSEAFAKVGVVCSVSKGRRKVTATDRLGKQTADVKVKHKAGCPDGWLTLSNFTDELGASLTTCFKVVESQPSTWSEAATYCESLDAHLAVMDTKEKSDWLYRQIANRTEYWIGGSDISHEGTWRWMTPRDMPISWNGWRSRQPSKTDAENCLAMDKQSAKSIGWNDENCNQEKPFICERSCCGLKCRRSY